MGGSQETPSNPSQFGFRIYKLIKDGPLAKGGAKEITDFIIPPYEVISQKNSFNDWILSLENKTITLKLYSLLYRDFKYIEITTNSKGTKEGILGAGVKYENYENADKSLLHITSVSENSFAKNKLGLIPEDDYIVALKTNNSPIISLNKEGYNPLEILNIVISSNEGNEVSFFIYNKKNGARIVEVKLEKEENEDKLRLGCDVAYGALHEFPRFVIGNDNLKEIKEIKENNDNEIKKEIEKENDVGNNTGEENKINEVDVIKGEAGGENKDNIINKEEKDNKEIIEEDII